MDRFVLIAFLVISLTMISAQLLGGAESIDDLSEPAVVAAANAAVQYLNRQNPPGSKELILVRIMSGTRQVVITYIIDNTYHIDSKGVALQ